MIISRFEHPFKCNKGVLILFIGFDDKHSLRSKFAELVENFTDNFIWQNLSTI